jgi:hypothetical protein
MITTETGRSIKLERVCIITTSKLVFLTLAELENDRTSEHRRLYWASPTVNQVVSVCHCSRHSLVGYHLGIEIDSFSRLHFVVGAQQLLKHRVLLNCGGAHATTSRL